MNKLGINEFPSFLDRFIGATDGLIRNIEIKYGDGRMETTITVVLSCRDKMTEECEGWVNLKLMLCGVTEYAFQQASKHSRKVLSNGIHLVPFEGSIVLEMGDMIDPPEADSDSFRHSLLFARGQELKWAVLPYVE